MNAGFEDCTLLSSILDEYGDDFATALHEYSERRWENAYTICDLAMYNYTEVNILLTTNVETIYWVIKHCQNKTLLDFLLRNLLY